MAIDPDPRLMALIEPHTGKVRAIQPPRGRGFSSDLTAIVECEQGPFFIKAMRNRPGGRRDSLLREKEVNPFVQSVSPRLMWDAEDGEWIALGFEPVVGRSSNFAPDSPDLPLVVDLLNRIGDLQLPEVARGWRETRWDGFAADDAEAVLFRGDALLHTDVNPENVIIGDQRARIVDWSWPTRGASLIDPSTLVVQLVASGHSPESAESWAARCTAWQNADPKAIDAFAAAEVRMLWSFAMRKPEEAWRRAMAEAAERWSTHRGLVVR